jgi:hypothetical protein
VFKLTTLASLGFALVLVSIAQAEDIIDAHIEALGGNDAIGKIKTIRRTGTVNGQGSIERSCIVGKKAIQSTGSNARTYVMAWNGKEAWVNLGAGVTEASPVIRATLQGWAAVNLVVPMAAADRADTFKFLGEREFEGATCETAELAAAPGVVIYFDKESKMFVGITGTTSAPEAGGDYTFTVTYSDFAKHEGVMFPATETTRMKTASGEMNLTYKFTKTEINAKLDDAMFEKPKAETTE